MKGLTWNKYMIRCLRKYNDHDLILMYERYIDALANPPRCGYNVMFVQTRMPFIKHEMKRRKLTP